MENKAHSDAQNLKIQGLIGRYLELRSAGRNRGEGGHIDEDSLTAFVEGRLTEREVLPMVGHLSDCGFCRNITTELVRLDLEMAEPDLAVQLSESAEPSKISDVLSGILSRIFGAGEAAVFAHEEKEKEENEDDEPKE